MWAAKAAYGQIPAIAPGNRIPAVRLTAQQQRAKSQRQDKTGSRTWQGMPAGMRLQTSFDLTSYMRDWPDPTALPSHGPLFEAAMGAPGVLWAGSAAGAGSSASNIVFATAHGLTPGQAIASGGEIRFVAAIADPHNGGVECTVFRRARRGRADRPDGNLHSGRATAELQFVRLLGPGDGRAESPVRRRGRYDDCEVERRLSSV